DAAVLVTMPIANGAAKLPATSAVKPTNWLAEMSAATGATGLITLPAVVISTERMTGVGVCVNGKLRMLGPAGLNPIGVAAAAPVVAREYASALPALAGENVGATALPKPTQKCARARSRLSVALRLAVKAEVAVIGLTEKFRPAGTGATLSK